MKEDVWYSPNPLGYFEDYCVHVKKPVDCAFVLVSFKEYDTNEDGIDYHLMWFEQKDWNVDDEVLLLFSVKNNRLCVKYSHVREKMGELRPNDFPMSLVKECVGVVGDVVIIDMCDCKKWKDHKKIMSWIASDILK